MSLFSESCKVSPDSRVKVLEGDSRYNIKGEDWSVEVLLFGTSRHCKLSAVKIKCHDPHHIELNIKIPPPNNYLVCITQYLLALPSPASFT